MELPYIVTYNYIILSQLYRVLFSAVVVIQESACGNVLKNVSLINTLTITRGIVKRTGSANGAVKSMARVALAAVKCCVIMSPAMKSVPEN